MMWRLGDIGDDMQSEGLCVTNTMAFHLNFSAFKGTEGDEYCGCDETGSRSNQVGRTLTQYFCWS